MGRGRKPGCSKIILVAHLPGDMNEASCPQDAFGRFYEEQLWKHISAYPPKVQLQMLREIKQRIQAHAYIGNKGGKHGAP